MVVTVKAEDGSTQDKIFSIYEFVKVAPTDALGSFTLNALTKLCLENYELSRQL